MVGLYGNRRDVRFPRIGVVVVLIAAFGTALWTGTSATEDECIEARARWIRLGSEADQAESDLHAANAYLERPYFTDSWRAEIRARGEHSEQLLLDLQVRASALVRHHPDCFSPAELIGVA